MRHHIQSIGKKEEKTRKTANKYVHNYLRLAAA